MRRRSVSDRNFADVKVTPVVRVPGMMTVNERLLACDNCGNLPIDVDDANKLELNMVTAPDRTRPVFLGPKCTEGERMRYVSYAPTNE